MNTYNKAFLIGLIGRDATHVNVNDKLNITSFSLATENSFKNKSGEWVNETIWHNIDVFNPSDYVANALKKGVKVFVEGRISSKPYTDKDGNKKIRYSIVSERIVILSKSTATENSIEAEQTDEPVEQSEPDLPF